MHCRLEAELLLRGPCRTKVGRETLAFGFLPEQSGAAARGRVSATDHPQDARQTLTTLPSLCSVAF